MQIVFSDGTQFDHAESLDWIDVADLLNFSSDVPSALSISTRGTITLHGNHHSRVSMIAAMSCSANIAGAVAVAANLKAAIGDVDLGSRDGVQFEQVGDSLTIDVFASVVGRLVNFELELAIDSGYLSVASLADASRFEGTLVEVSSSSTLVKLISNNWQSMGHEAHRCCRV